MRVHHQHVLILTKLGQALSVEIRLHNVILSTSRHGLSLQIQCVSFRMSHVSNMLVQITFRPPRSIGTVRRVPFCQRNRRPAANFDVLILMAPLLPCTPACGEATSRICQVSQMSQTKHVLETWNSCQQNRRDGAHCAWRYKPFPAAFEMFLACNRHLHADDLSFRAKFEL